DGSNDPIRPDLADALAVDKIEAAVRPEIEIRRPRELCGARWPVIAAIPLYAGANDRGNDPVRPDLPDAPGEGGEVRDVQAAVRPYGAADRPKLSLRGRAAVATEPVRAGAGDCRNDSIRPDFADPIIISIHDVEATVRPQGNIARDVKLSLRG